MARRRWPFGERTLRVEGTKIPSASTKIASTAPYDQKFFDANGNLVFEDTGTIHATRLNFNATAHRRSLKHGAPAWKNLALIVNQKL